MSNYATVKDRLHYEPSTGKFTWIYKNNGVSFGKEAGHIGNQGYRFIKIDHKKYYAHRLAVLYMTGNWPKDQVDHINRSKSDNRWDNLRECSHTDNQNNKDCNVAVKGVYWHTTKNKWQANGEKHKYLGTFDDWFDAVCAVKSSEVLCA